MWQHYRMYISNSCAYRGMLTVIWLMYTCLEPSVKSSSLRAVGKGKAFLSPLPFFAFPLPLSFPFFGIRLDHCHFIRHHNNQSSPTSVFFLTRMPVRALPPYLLRIHVYVCLSSLLTWPASSPRVKGLVSAAGWTGVQIVWRAYARDGAWREGVKWRWGGVGGCMVW